MRRLRLVLQSTAILLVSAFGAAFMMMSRLGPVDLQTAGVSLAIPTLSALLFLCVSFAIPDLYAVGSLKFPSNLTLPAIYASLLLLSAILVSRVGLSISQAPAGLSGIALWQRPALPIATFALGALLMTLLASLERKPSP